MPSYLVTGSSRGIGLSFVEELLKDPQNVVIATARNPHTSQGLLKLQEKHTGNNLKVIALDVTDETSVARVVEEVTSILPTGLDCIINNAAVALQSFKLAEHCDLDLTLQEMNVNVISQIRVVRAFLPLIRSGHDKKVVFISSDSGSLEFAPNISGLGGTYSLTKAALNMLGRTWGTSLRAEGITVVLLHPGWVATDMGNELNDWVTQHMPNVEKFTAEECAVRCIRVIKEAKLEDAVKFYDLNGAQVPW